MAMSGLRELSVIQTPPVDRLAVRTYVAPWDPVVVREALLREHYRGGQSFLVTPRIADLPDLEEWLREEVPEVKAVTAHGQMSPSEVEERMSAFYDRKYDVLLSTTIIESGLDIPSANTLIVNRADRFGLAQLYQLRGRVGRSKTRAYAYLTTEPDRALTEGADKRLQVLVNLDSLGAGFQLASHDLDIRGAGNLLGDEQSGHIKEVGFELYQSMLEDAILELKSGVAERREEFAPQISVEAPILIPEAYVPDLDLRMGLYRRLGELDDRQGVEAFAAELIDRFGKLPSETQNLLQIVETKINCKKACIAKLDVGAKGAVVTFADKRFPRSRRAARLCRAAEGRGAAPSGQQAGRQPRLADRRGAIERRAADFARADAGACGRRNPQGAGAGLGRASLALSPRSAPTRPHRALRRQGSPGRGRSPTRRGCGAGPCFPRLRRSTLRPSSRAMPIIALTTIRSRSPPTISAIIARSILIASIGRVVR